MILSLYRQVKIFFQIFDKYNYQLSFCLSSDTSATPFQAYYAWFKQEVNDH